MGEVVMARVALLADIHGNYEAFQAVMRDVDKSAADVIVCLGDLVGYGPDPHKCIDLAFECCSKLILGNHDEAALRGRRRRRCCSHSDRDRIGICWPPRCYAA